MHVTQCQADRKFATFDSVLAFASPDLLEFQEGAAGQKIFLSCAGALKLASCVRCFCHSGLVYFFFFLAILAGSAGLKAITDRHIGDRHAVDI